MSTNNEAAARTKYASELAAAAPQVVGGIATYLPANTSAAPNLTVLPSTEGWTTLDLHDWTALKHAISYETSKIHLEVGVAGANSFGIMDGFSALQLSTTNYAAVYLSYHELTFVGISQAINRFATTGTIFVAHTYSLASDPGNKVYYPDPPPNLVVAVPIASTGAPQNSYYAAGGVNCFGIYTNASSWATPKLSSAIAFLRLLRPNLTVAEIINVLQITAAPNTAEPTLPIVDILAASDYVMDNVPASVAPVRGKMFRRTSEGDSVGTQIYINVGGVMTASQIYVK